MPSTEARTHCGEVTWASWRFKTAVTRLFVQQLVDTSDKVIIEARYYWSFLRWFPTQRPSNAEYFIHVWRHHDNMGPINVLAPCIVMSSTRRQQLLYSLQKFCKLLVILSFINQHYFRLWRLIPNANTYFKTIYREKDQHVGPNIVTPHGWCYESWSPMVQIIVAWRHQPITWTNVDWFLTNCDPVTPNGDTYLGQHLLR